MAGSPDAYRRQLASGALLPQLAELYSPDGVARAQVRLERLLDRFEDDFGDMPVLAVSAPGRTELGGNHTDHNHGCVLAAAVHLDCLAVAGAVTPDDRTVVIHSRGYADPIVVDLANTAPRPEEEGTSRAIVRGVAHGLLERGHRVCGFRACVDSTVPMGAGLSSSAAFEVLVCSIFNHLANAGSVSDLDTARISRRAENVHFGKPCGFMDQIACAHRGVLYIDFRDPDNPGIERIDFDPAAQGWRLAVVNTGGSHADLTPDYAAIPEEMFTAARVLGHGSCRDVSQREAMAAMAQLRAGAGDRAILRLLHFLGENRRAGLQAAALRQGDERAFLRLVAESGDSSWKLLQNVQSPGHAEQPIPLALALTERLLDGQGAWRVHGGGFAGTIQVYVPEQRFTDYAHYMNDLFGPESVIPLNIRSAGGCVMEVDD